MSVVVPSSTIEAANKAVKGALDTSEQNCTHKETHGQYETFSSKKKEAIMRNAVEIGVSNARP